jgi:inner membrane protein
VKLLLPIDEYQKTMRTAKYAIMFIALTFLAFFLTEILNKKVIHPIQYILIGLALILFYTLLLSFSEHVRFNFAYLISSTAIIALVTAYTKSVLANNLATAVIAGILIILYGFLYVILQLQDYALLLGSIGLFVILAIVMYITRNIDWFAIGKPTVEHTR